MAATRILIIYMVVVVFATFGLAIHSTAGLSSAVVCRLENFAEGDPRIGCMEDFLDDMVQNCLYPTKFCRTGGYKICSDSSTIYGSASSALSGCLEEAKQSIFSACPNATGAQSNVESGVCELRYETYPYLD
ncbi:hypothetical protein LINGRAHAP2_LOCUS31649 [Linum grandiflorum]